MVHISCVCWLVSLCMLCHVLFGLDFEVCIDVGQSVFLRLAGLPATTAWVQMRSLTIGLTAGLDLPAKRIEYLDSGTFQSSPPLRYNFAEEDSVETYLGIRFVCLFVLGFSEFLFLLLVVVKPEEQTHTHFVFDADSCVGLIAMFMGKAMDKMHFMTLECDLEVNNDACFSPSSSSFCFLFFFSPPSKHHTGIIHHTFEIFKLKFVWKLALSLNKHMQHVHNQYCIPSNTYNTNSRPHMHFR